MSGDPNLWRWRLVLGQPAESAMGQSLDARGTQADEALEWLYGEGREGGDGASVLSVPEWLDRIHTLFPRQTVERLEKDAVEVYGIDEIVTDPEVLGRAEPNEALLGAVLKTKHLMNPELLELARELIRRVVQRLMDELTKEIRSVFSGAIDRRRRSPLKVAKNLDLRQTLRTNLKHYDGEAKKVLVERALFFSRTRRQGERWQVILLVDQSGSMMDSVIHSAVTAACLWGLPSVRTHLCIFDTEVVDLSDAVTDPVETLMKVQLGGGTDIAKAVGYGAGLVESPDRTIFVIISDFYEGGSEWQLVQRVKALAESGVHVLALGALDREAFPAWNKETAQRLAQVGAHAGAMTPAELASFIAEKVRG